MLKRMLAVFAVFAAIMTAGGCATKAQNAALAGAALGYTYGVATARQYAPPQPVYYVPAYRDTPCGRVSIDSQYECMLRTRTWSNGVVERYYVWVRR